MIFFPKVKIAWFMLTFVVLPSCNRESSDIVYRINYLYCETEDDEEPGFIDAQGNICKLQTDEDVFPVVLSSTLTLLVTFIL